MHRKLPTLGLRAVTTTDNLILLLPGTLTQAQVNTLTYAIRNHCRTTRTSQAADN